LDVDAKIVQYGKLANKDIDLVLDAFEECADDLDPRVMRHLVLKTKAKYKKLLPITEDNDYE
jgi:hypothetical protein